MADPTPPSDIPDPDSSNPAPAPAATPAGPKRIRSMPVREKSGSMATSTYVTDSKSDDANPGRGLTILWTLFLLTAAAEACNAAFHLLAGHDVWPLPYDAGRVALVCSLFLGLYVGWEWLRFLLAAVDLAAGVWFLINVIAVFQGGPKVKGANVTYVLPFTIVEAYPRLALGALYLITAVYLVLSSDALGFIRRRRTQGRVGPALLVAVLLYGYLIAVFLAQPIYASWLRGKLVDAQNYGRISLEQLAYHWDPAYYTDNADPGSLEDWSDGARKSTFEGLSSLGQLQSTLPPTPAVITAKDIGPLQKVAPVAGETPMAGEIISGVSKDGQHFLLAYRYFTKEATFVHGKGQFGFDLVRGLSGSWRLAKFSAVNIQKDQPPAPPVPPVDPNAPAAPAASPSDAAAPGASVTPAPSSTVAPPPAAATTPVASPVPSTGG